MENAEPLRADNSFLLISTSLPFQNTDAILWRYALGRTRPFQVALASIAGDFSGKE